MLVRAQVHAVACILPTQWQAAIEALGMSLPYSSSNPALSEDKQKECAAIGAAIKLLLEKDIKPRDIMTRKAFENAITVIMVLGGSTNAVLHLIAMAKSVGVDLTQDDFQTISDKIPVLADFKPSGKYLMEDLASIWWCSGCDEIFIE